MMLEVNDDCIDQILGAELVQTYKQLKKDLKNPKKWHVDDLQAFQDVFEALKIVGPFFVFDWNKKIK